MHKALLGLILGGILGIFDGLTAWFTPAARPEIFGIVLGSTMKGLIAGVLIGYFARKVNSLPLGIVFGLGVGLILAYAVAAMQPGPNHYYFEIMLPGGIVGVIIGYATQRFGRIPESVTR
jgi:peptidoglycan/LPS O-acetylase OafA/YrhL